MNFLHLPSFYRILSTQQKKWTYSTKTGMPGHIFYLQMILPTKMIKRNMWRMILRGRISSSLPHLHPLYPGGTRSQNLQKYRNISGNMRLNLTGCKFWDVIFCCNIYHVLTSIYISVNISSNLQTMWTKSFSDIQTFLLDITSHQRLH